MIPVIKVTQIREKSEILNKNSNWEDKKKAKFVYSTFNDCLI